MADNRPIIGITMGDPCGIGAEIIVRSLSGGAMADKARFIIFGFSEQLAYTADQLELPFSFHRERPEDIHRFAYDVVVLDYDDVYQPVRLPRGSNKSAGAASMRFCQDAITAALAGNIDAIVTAPISKTSWQLAGFKKFPGHTELLADRCKSQDVAMMFATPKLKVVLATIHEALFDVRNIFTIGCVFRPIDLAYKAMRDWFGIDRPKIAVCGLNPHAGEEGQFGDEEDRVIKPAILMAGESGMKVDGPFPADTIFLKAWQGKYDCVIAMYHDQGLIPIKLTGWDKAVNLTLGLPIIRTSPAHGTAFDIAGRFIADPSSMKSAIEMAIELTGKKGPATPRNTGEPPKI